MRAVRPSAIAAFSTRQATTQQFRGAMTRVLRYFFTQYDLWDTQTLPQLSFEGPHNLGGRCVPEHRDQGRQSR